MAIGGPGKLQVFSADSPYEASAGIAPVDARAASDSKNSEAPAGIVPAAVHTAADPKSSEISATAQTPADSGGSATDAVTLMLFVSWLESSLPLFVEIFSERLYQYMSVARETELARRFTDPELKLHVVQRVQEKFAGQLSDVDTQILPSGILASGVVSVGLLRYRLLGRFQIMLEEEYPHLVIDEIQMGDQPIPGFLLRQIEARVNEAIDRQNHLLRVKEFQLYDGWAYISVEIA